MKTTVSDFKGQFSAYSVTTDNGNAYKSANYGRAVDIGGPASTVLTTAEAQALYGDSHALKVVNPGRWPGKIRLIQTPIHLVTLSLTFNEIVRMAASLSQKHGGVKLDKVPNTGEDKLSRAFAAAAQANGLRPLGQFFVTSRSLLESFTANELPETERGMSDGYMETPNEIVATYSHEGEILKDIHIMLLFNEGDFPGYASRNLYHVSGLYLGAPREAKLPVPAQNKPPLAMLLPELRRTL